MASVLSQRLRSETKAAHTAAERSGIMRGLLRGTITREAYVGLMQNLRALYGALEAELDRHQQHPALAAVDWNALRRLPAIEHDLAQLAEPGESAPELEAATHDYVSRLHTLGNTDVALLFAHAYLRYLGDLYGGQIIRGIVERVFGARYPHAIAFYEFPAIPDMGQFKLGFRSAIDGIPREVADPDQLVAEAQHGYVLHAQMFDELAARFAMSGTTLDRDS